MPIATARFWRSSGRRICGRRSPIPWAGRIETPAPRLDLATIGRLDFQAPDAELFPAIRLARQALQTGGAAPTILNAANEVAVEAFLADRIGFLDIARIVEETLQRLVQSPIGCLDEVDQADADARRMAAGLVGSD